MAHRKAASQFLPYVETNILRTYAHKFKWNLLQKVNDWYDNRLGIDASGIIASDELGHTGVNAVHSYVYHGTPHSALSIVFRLLKIRYSDFSFIDLGSGKARVVARASQFPFKQVIGVELSSMLHAAAKRNIENLKQISAPKTVVRLENCDVIEFAIPKTPLLIFNFNGFQKTVLKGFVTGLEHSLQKDPRDCYFIYLNPKNGDVIENHSSLEKQHIPLFYRVMVRLFSPWPLAIYKVPTPAK